ncbi:carboxylesterase family protein [Sphingobacterium sp. SRCM116780]|uniref:carboxylesterase family protein n=1 Tax=Sphingobacterium sp. SRCM116780 TaxID=2907623 RepID=UPI001F28CC8B|nr:carboxylesterase family protein [Sphingobacterium sp. SRCM116780]UIR57422.1 carboxylesterase family protein [Sphingobacterium sp. SRCM116780]
MKYEIKKWDKKNMIILILGSCLFLILVIFIFGSKVETLIHNFYAKAEAYNQPLGTETQYAKAEAVLTEEKEDSEDNFTEIIDPQIAWQRDIPADIKNVLFAYLKSEDGSPYGFVNDRRPPKEIIRYGTFSGINEQDKTANNELAIILREKNAIGNDRERVLVICYDDRNYKYNILYNELFYNKLLIKTYSTSDQLPSEASSLAEFVSPIHQLIQIKTNSQDTVYLYYDEEFDSMVRKTFHQEEAEEG